MTCSLLFSSLFHSSPVSDDKLHLTLLLSTQNMPLSLCLCYSFCLECASLSQTNVLLFLFPTHLLIPSSNAPFSRKYFPRQKPLLSLSSPESSFSSLIGAQHAPCWHFPCVCLPHMFEINLRAETRFELFLDSQHEQQSHAQL